MDVDKLTILLELDQKSEKELFFYIKTVEDQTILNFIYSSKYRIKEIKPALAENPKTPVYILDELADDKSSHIRSGVACNENTPERILEKLSNDEDIIVRYGVAMNSNISREIAERFSKDDNLWIRYKIAGNMKTPLDILEKLSTDENYFVRILVKQTLVNLGKEELLQSY